MISFLTESTHSMEILCYFHNPYICKNNYTFLLQQSTHNTSFGIPSSCKYIPFEKTTYLLGLARFENSLSVLSTLQIQFYCNKSSNCTLLCKEHHLPNSRSTFLNILSSHSDIPCVCSFLEKISHKESHNYCPKEPDQRDLCQGMRIMKRKSRLR